MRGTVRKARFVALLLPCLVVATAAAGAQNKGLEVNVSSGLNTASFEFVTPQSVSAELDLGKDKSYGLVVQLPKQKNHSITVPALQPATRYYYKVVAATASGKSVSDQGSFKTDPIGSAQLSVHGGKVTLNAARFVPLMVYGYNCATADYVTAAAGLGASTLAEANPGIQKPCDPDTLHSALNGRMWWYNSSADQASLSGMPELLSGSIRFIEVAAPVGDIYDRIKEQSSQGPVVNEINVAPMHDPSHVNRLTADQFHAQFWMTFIACGDGVEYYAHGDSFDSISIKPDLLAAARTDGAKLAVLGPVVTSGRCLPVQHNQSSPVQMTRWVYGGATYVIAVNTSTSPQDLRFTVPGSAGSSVQVLWEGRGKKVVRDTITDNFDPLEVHFYRIVPKK